MPNPNLPLQSAKVQDGLNAGTDDTTGHLRLPRAALAAEAVPMRQLYPEIVAQMSRIEKGGNQLND
jgi:hypothetical protein